MCSVWQQDARVGPMIILPAKQKSGRIPAEELPAVLDQVTGPSRYGSQWRSVRKDNIGECFFFFFTGMAKCSYLKPFKLQLHYWTWLLTDGDAGINAVLLEKSSPEDDVKSKAAAALDEIRTAALEDVIPNAQFTVDVTQMSNETGNVLWDTKMN